MIKVSIEGYGNFQISNEKLQELLNWLTKNQGIRIQEAQTFPAKFHGKQLIQG
jgi:hypothetical protein